MSRERTDRVQRLVQGLAQARNAQSEGRDEHARRERPSRAALDALVKSLRAALFPAHFGQSDFSEAGLNELVADAIEHALAILELQVRRELAYASDTVTPDLEALSTQARAIVDGFAAALPRIRSELEKDVRAALEGDPAAKSRAEVLFCYPGVTAIIHHRIAHELCSRGVPLIARMVSEISRAMTGIDIHPGARIGDSFFVDHGTGVVIGETTIIGARVRLYQGVTLGAKSFVQDSSGALVKGQPRHPIIEDDVVIYAGASILGRVTVGRGSIIGGNVWVTEDVPPHSRLTQARNREQG